MKLRLMSMKLSNYRLYYDDTTLNFGTNDNKNVTVVLGKNGAGKSTLLNAMTWCLYGIEAHIENSKTKDGMPIINTTALRELKDGGFVSAEVSIFLEIDGKTSQISRTLTAKKIGASISYDPEKFKVFITNPELNTDTYEGKDAVNYIETLIPEALRSFFFIDGEQLRTFFQISTPEKIEDAIDRLSRLDILNSVNKSLSDYTRDLSSKCKSNDPEVKRINEEKDKCNNFINTWADLLARFRRDLDESTRRYDEANEYLKNINEVELSKLQTEKEEKKSLLNNIQKQLNEEKRKRNLYLSDIAPFIYMKDTISDALTVLDGMAERGELPEKVRQVFIQDLLDNGVCICGNKIGYKERETLLAYERKMRRSEVSDTANNGRFILKDCLKKIDKFDETISGFNETINELNTEYSIIISRLEEIEVELNDFDEDEIKLKVKQSRDAEININHCKNEIERYKQAKEAKEKQKEKLDSALNTALQKDKAQETLRKKLLLANETIKYLKSIQSEVKSRIRSSLEKNTEKTFMSLERKKDAFQNVTIDSKFNVNVHHIDGYNALNNLSAGEYLLLGLSFMYALRSISGYLMPVLIDTPLGKIDDEHRDNITQQLPKLLEGSQLILLVTPTEYDPMVQKNLDQFVSKGANYKIVENKDKTTASLEVVS